MLLCRAHALSTQVMSGSLPDGQRGAKEANKEGKYTEREYIWKNIMTHLSYIISNCLSLSNTLISPPPHRTQRPVVTTCGSCVLIITVSLTVICAVFHSFHYSHTNQISLQTVIATVAFSSSMTQNKNIKYFPIENTE